MTDDGNEGVGRVSVCMAILITGGIGAGEDTVTSDTSVCVLAALLGGCQYASVCVALLTVWLDSRRRKKDATHPTRQRMNAIKLPKTI